MNLTIFMYQPTEGKFLHTQSFGHKIYLIDSPIESDAHRMAEEASKKFGWALLTTMSSANPFNIEGYKTISFEIIRDIGLPDVVVVPMGSGTLVLGICKGFKELFKMGIISKLPWVAGIQSLEINPIDRAYQRGESKIEAIVPGKTMATGVVVDNPGIAGEVALKGILETGGFVVSVPEENILESFKLLPLEEGIFAEPTGALSFAGLKLAMEKGLVKSGEKVVCIDSATGFKDLKAFKRLEVNESQVRTIKPSLEYV